MIRWEDSVSDLEERLVALEEYLAGQRLLKAEFDEKREASYGPYSGIAADYESNALRMPHQGRIYCFHARGRTFTVALQEAVEDHDANQPGFAFIESSLIVE